jgi:hypothetical protein
MLCCCDACSYIINFGLVVELKYNYNGLGRTSTEVHNTRKTSVESFSFRKRISHFSLSSPSLQLLTRPSLLGDFHSQIPRRLVDTGCSMHNSRAHQSGLRMPEHT